MKKILKFCFNTSTWNPTKVEWIHLFSSIAKEERDRVVRFVFKRDSKQTLMGQILIRYCLKTMLNIETNNVCLGRNSKERPYLKVKETLQLSKMNNFEYLVDFNVSHNGDYTIICAGMISCQLKKLDELEGCFRIGTDVMKIDIRNRQQTNDLDEAVLFEQELSKHERVINSEFSESEKTFIYSKRNPVEKLSAFYRLWCLKESYVKALGEGIGFDIKRVETIPNSELFIDLLRKKHLVVDDTKLMVDSKIVKNCKFYEQYFTTKSTTTTTSGRVQLHVMTICVIEKDNKIKTSSNELLKTESDEFVEVNLTDIMTCLVPIDKLDDNNTKEFEDCWVKFAEKAESPFI